MIKLKIPVTKVKDEMLLIPLTESKNLIKIYKYKENINMPPKNPNSSEIILNIKSIAVQNL